MSYPKTGRKYRRKISVAEAFWSWERLKLAEVGKIEKVHGVILSASHAHFPFFDECGEEIPTLLPQTSATFLFHSKLMPSLYISLRK